MAKNDETQTPVDAPTDAPDASNDFPNVTPGALAPMRGLDDFEGDIVAMWELARPGDSWDVIAERNSTTAEALCALNADQPHFSERGVVVNTLVRVR